MTLKELSGGAAVALLLMAFSAPASAQADSEDTGPVVSVAATAGTLGAGPQIGLRFSDRVGVRADAAFLSASADFDSDDITYGGDLKLKSFGAMVDLYPFGGAFRLSAGARINQNRVDVRATPTGTVEVGDTTYTAAQVGTLTGGADVKKLAPALTLGWGGSKRKGFFFTAEGGVLFQGAARLREFRASGTLQNDANFKASLERERVSLQDDISKVKVYPIAQLGLGWRF
ncbi:hypothetical protein ACFSC3_07055 [Sphingomonas floccifaciens]|uniref:Outer membrane protein beta-barrel domain-containing protein n=2 Tax=Sphingomonas floccifaciens TaxID=1844115 RepID=A0ABW4NBZ8_9SPHN